jgi:hypothetical protein
VIWACDETASRRAATAAANHDHLSSFVGIADPLS